VLHLGHPGNQDISASCFNKFKPQQEQLRYYCGLASTPHLPMNLVLQELIDRVRDANSRRAPLCIRGAGSKDFYGESLQGEQLNTRSYTGIVAYEPSELVVTVRAGTPLSELEALLADRGQCLAFEPPRFGSYDTLNGGTCGGMVAAGLSGPSRASAGSVRDYVLGVQMVNGRGEHLTFGGQVMKNVAGYDVSRLMVGAMGTLGLLTDLSLKVLPVAPAEATLVFPVDQSKALAQLHKWGGQPLPLNASCWIKDDSSGQSQELLFVRLRGAVAAVESACENMLREVSGSRMDTQQAAADWLACRNQTLPFFTPPTKTMEPPALWRLSVPQTTPALKLPWAQLVEWHGAQRWLWAPESAKDQLRKAAADAGGSATIFIAAPTAKLEARGRFSPMETTVAKIHQRLKAEFDPAGIFNRGRMYLDF
jgi:glycolate oxidase FAD binding subunit